MSHDASPMSHAAPPQIILASASPRRAALLRQIGLPFRVQASALGDDGETALPGEAPEPHAARLALAKAREVATRLGKGVVIGADTVVAPEERILGKPADPAEARAFLLALSGRTHRVVTGVAVVDAATGRFEVATAVTSVRMRGFGAGEAEAYVATGEPMDKAGAYGIQGRGALLVEAIEGDYFNVVGLPLVLLADLLQRFGIDVGGGTFLP
jgi:septum formation protein